jgi:hypothetical protein
MSLRERVKTFQCFAIFDQGREGLFLLFCNNYNISVQVEKYLYDSNVSER